MARWRLWRTGALALVLGPALAAQALGDGLPLPTKIDLARPFKTRSAWRLAATEGPAAVDYGGNPAPGSVTLCLEKVPGGICASDPSAMPPPRAGASYDGWEPHYLNLAAAVYPRGPASAPLLMIVTASMHAGDGGQVVATQLFRYVRASDKFERIYAHDTGSNNNEEVRFVTAGPLQGDVIAAEPTQNAPYGYWITVSSLTPDWSYKEVLRYRSATRYGDGNRLAVIDSETPNIEQRLGLWRPGSPPPLPAGACPRPRLVRTELWCE